MPSTKYAARIPDRSSNGEHGDGADLGGRVPGDLLPEQLQLVLRSRAVWKRRPGIPSGARDRCSFPVAGGSRDGLRQRASSSRRIEANDLAVVSAGEGALPVDIS